MTDSRGGSRIYTGDRTPNGSEIYVDDGDNIHESSSSISRESWEAKFEEYSKQEGLSPLFRCNSQYEVEKVPRSIRFKDPPARVGLYQLKRFDFESIRIDDRTKLIIGTICGLYR
jgi:hypothetical protein